MTIGTHGNRQPVVITDQNGNAVDIIFTAGVRRLAVDALISSGDIEIGAVELKDGATDTRESVKSDATAISAAPNDGGALIAGRDGATQRHVRVSATGELIPSPNILTPSAPANVVIGAASAALVAANATRRYLAIGVQTSGARISLHLTGGVAVLDAGVTIRTGTTYIFDASGIPRGAINAIGNMAGISVSVQDAS